MKGKRIWGMAIIIVVLSVVVIWLVQGNGQEDAQVDDHAEYEEQERIRNFFTELRGQYGYLYAGEEPFQLFITFDEALLEGELTGSLLVREQTNDGTFKETYYDVNGITDGKILELYTTLDGESTKLEGEFQGEATRFELSFWMAEERLSFHAVTEEEYKEVFEE